VIDNPILNSPFREPTRHFRFDEDGITNEIADGRRRSTYFIPIPKPKIRGGQLALPGDWVGERATDNDTINRIREHVTAWRTSHYPGITTVTRDLLDYWNDPTREKPLFFCQIEALETAIFLGEVAGRTLPWIENKLREENQAKNPGLYRIAFKMATGSGKTVVMGMIIAWQALNKLANSQDKRFSDTFLIVTPTTRPDGVRQLIASESGCTGRRRRWISERPYLSASRTFGNRRSSPSVMWVTTKTGSPSTDRSYPWVSRARTQRGGLHSGGSPSTSSSNPSISRPAIQPGRAGEPSGIGAPVRPRGSWRTEAASLAVTRSLRAFGDIEFALRGAPCGDEPGWNGAGRASQLAARTGLRTLSSPSPDLAIESSRLPELTRPRVPSAMWQSRTRHFGGIPRSTSASTAGHASRVVSKRPTTLFEGISRSEYPTAPSIRIPKPSGNRGPFARLARLKSKYRWELRLTSSSSYVFIAFALRGAPCGDDPRQRKVALGGYHCQQAGPLRPADGQLAWFVDGMPKVWHLEPTGIREDRLCFVERDAVLADICLTLPFVPVEVAHGRDNTQRHSPATYPRKGEISVG
jgi:hypothetical protein